MIDSISNGEEKDLILEFSKYYNISPEEIILRSENLKSNILHNELIRNGTWGKIQSRISGLLDILTFYKSIGTSFPQSRPTLSTGDVVFSETNRPEIPGVPKKACSFPMDVPTSQIGPWGA